MTVNTTWLQRKIGVARRYTPDRHFACIQYMSHNFQNRSHRFAAGAKAISKDRTIMNLNLRLTTVRLVLGCLVIKSLFLQRTVVTTVTDWISLLPHSSQLSPLKLLNTSKLHWETIEQFATNIQNSSFCLPWSVNSDLWWTHHPDWFVSEENQQEYCFSIIPDEKKRNYFLNFYQTQFPPNQTCPNDNTHLSNMWSSGWGADIENVASQLMYANHVGRPMEVNRRPWHYAAPDQAGKANKKASRPACPKLNMYCYFLNLTACGPTADARTWSNQDPNVTKSFIISRNHEMYWAMEYVTRPQTWLRKRVFDMVHSAMNEAGGGTLVNGPLQKPYSVIHVRRSDVVLHDRSSRKYHAIAEYLNETDARLAEGGPDFKIRRNVLLLTDDSNAIKEALALHPEYRWMYLNRTRWTGSEGGFERQLPSSDPIVEVATLYATFKLVSHCETFSYGSSNFGRVLKTHVENNGGLFWNIDYGKADIHGVNNSKTVSISHMF